MKNKGLLITCIVLLSVITVLLLGFMIYSIADNSGSFGIVQRVASEVIYNNSFDNVTDISIDSDCGDITVSESADSDVHLIAYGESKDDITVNSVDGTLIIKYPQKRKFFNISTTKNNIELTVPKGYDRTVKITSSYGDVDICALPDTSIEIDCDYGDVNLSEIKNAVVTNDCGDVKIDKVAVADVEVDYGKMEIGTITQSCKLQNDCGDITVEAMNITANSTIDNDLGKITVRNAPGIRVDAETDLGKVNVTQNDENAAVKLTITNSCGDINVGK